MTFDHLTRDDLIARMNDIEAKVVRLAEINEELARRAGEAEGGVRLDVERLARAMFYGHFDYVSDEVRDQLIAAAQLLADRYARLSPESDR